MSPSQKTRGVLLILLLYVVIAIIGFFIVYFIKTTFFHSSPTPQSNVPLAGAKPTNTSTLKNWKTYQNPTTHIAISYPPTLNVQAKTYPLGITDIEMRTADNTNPSDTADVQILVVPKTLAMATGQDFQSLYSLPNKTTKTIKQSLGGSKVSQKFTKLSNSTIDQHRALRYRSVASDAAPSDEAEVGVFIEDGNNLMLISAGASDQKELDKMLQTIKLPN